MKEDPPCGMYEIDQRKDIGNINEAEVETHAKKYEMPCGLIK
jgi:hypothetical protein